MRHEDEDRVRRLAVRSVSSGQGREEILLASYRSAGPERSCSRPSSGSPRRESLTLT